MQPMHYDGGGTYHSGKKHSFTPKLPKLPIGRNELRMPGSGTMLGLALENKRMKSSLKILINYLKAHNIPIPNIPYDVNLNDAAQDDLINRIINENLPYHMEKASKNTTPELNIQTKSKKKKNLNKSFGYSQHYDEASDDEIIRASKVDLNRSRKNMRDMSAPKRPQESNANFEPRSPRTLDTLQKKKGLRTLKYLSRPFDFKANLEGISGGDMLNDIILAKLKGRDFQLLAEWLTEPSTKDAFFKRIHNSTMEILLTYILVRNVSFSYELNKNLALLVQLLAIILNTEKVVVFLYDKVTEELYSKVANFQLRDQIIYKSGNGIVGLTFSKSEIYVNDNTLQDELFDKRVYRTYYLEAPKNVACFPLRYGMHTVGVLELCNYRTPIEENINLIRMICEQMSAGFILFETNVSNNQLSKQEEPMSAKYEQYEDLKILTKIMDCDLAFMYLKDPDSNMIRLEVQYGAEEMYDKDLSDELCFDVRLDKNMLTESFNSNNLIFKENDSGGLDLLYARLGIKTSIIYPLNNSINDLPFGLLHFASRRSNPLNSRGQLLAEVFSRKYLLSRKAEKFSELLDILDFSIGQMNDVIIALNGKCTVVYANKYLEHILKRQLDSMIGRDITEIFGRANMVILSNILNTIKNNRSTEFQNLRLEMEWNEYNLGHEKFGAKIKPLPVNLKVVIWDNPTVKYLIIIQPIILVPDKTI